MRLTKAQRAAIERAKPDGSFRADPRTVRAMVRRGLALPPEHVDPKLWPDFARLAQLTLPFGGG